MRRFWHVLEPNTLFVEGWALQAMCEHLEAVTFGDINRLLMNVPPGFMKSLLTNVFWPLWEWSIGLAHHRFATFSYSASLTERDNRRFLDLIKSRDYQEVYGDKFGLRKQGETLISNDKTGWKLASSVGGVATGERGDRVLCFPGYEIIQTERGPKNIEDIVKNRTPIRVWSMSPNGDMQLKPVSAFITNPASDLMRITMDDGSALICTPNHRLLGMDGFIPAASFIIGDILCTAPCGMFGPSSDVAVPKLQVEVSPNSTKSDTFYRLMANVIGLAKLCSSFLMLCRDFPNKLLSQMRSAVAERAVSFGISNILGACSIFEIAGFRVRPIPVFMTHIVPKRSFSNKSSSHKNMNFAIGRLSISTEGHSRIAFDEGRRHDAGRNGYDLISSAPRLPRKCLGSGFDAPHVGNQISRKTDDRLPMLVRKVAKIEVGFGHVDETFCLTVDDNHNMFVGSGMSSILATNCDDPHSIKDSESDQVRQETVRWFREAMSNRLNDMEKSAIVVIMQRVHEEDVSGAIIESNSDYCHLMIPMEYDGRHYTTPIGWTDPRTMDGELAWPERFSAKVVEGIKDISGPYAYAGQYQQAPSPRGGGIFKRDWWQFWENPDDPNDPRFKRFPQCEYVLASLDSAYTEKDENDYSALTIWGVFRNEHDLPMIILMAAWQARLAIHDLVERTAETCKRFKVDHFLIEAKASGISVAQELRRLYADQPWGVQLIDPKGDKVARAYAVQHLFSDEMVWAPRRAWSDMVITQMSQFPKSAHKDLVDSSTQALRFLRQTGLAVHGAEIQSELNELMRQPGTPAKPLYPA